MPGAAVIRALGLFPGLHSAGQMLPGIERHALFFAERAERLEHQILDRDPLAEVPLGGLVLLFAVDVDALCARGPVR